ncbi:DUF4809 family protein [Enterococcus sp. AZ109]|uniref:DUF4809 family protein n=1 Tax=Enterococcus sp. AZ109 TaxID=2774634 RepID=UPI003F20E5F1
MQQAVINKQVFTTEGGCNACGFQSYITYTLHFEDGQTSLLDEYDVPSIVTALVMKNGWRQTYIQVDMGEEALVFKREDQQVEVEDLGTMLVYQGVHQAYPIPKVIPETEVLFQRINQLLQDVFDCEGYILSELTR